MGMIHRYYRARRHARDGLDTQTHSRTGENDTGKGEDLTGSDRPSELLQHVYLFILLCSIRQGMLQIHIISTRCAEGG